jgi:hypothetical protein
MGNVTYEDYTLAENISRYVLSVGRSMSLLLVPISISAAYDQGNLLNLAGIPLIVLTLFLFRKGKEDTLLWLLLAALSHILTYIAFVHDTYLYLTLICLLVAGNFYFQNNPLKLAKEGKLAIPLIFLAFFTYKTIDASKMWLTDLGLWQYSHANEKSPYSAIILASHLMPHDEELGLSFLEWGAENFNFFSHRPLLIFFLHTVYTSSIPIERKIKILEDSSIDHEIYKGYLGLTFLEGSHQQMEKGVAILKPLLLPESEYTPDSEGIKILKSIKYLCKNIPGKAEACDRLGITY